VTQDLGEENELNSSQDNKGVKPVRPNIKQRGISTQQPSNNQPYPPTKKSGISIVTIFLSILVIILLISTIVSIGMLSSEINKINEKLDDAEENQDDLSDELKVTELKLNNVLLELNDTRNDYDELQDNYENLQDDFNELKDDYDELQDNYENLQDDFNELKGDYDELQDNYTNLQEDFNELKDDYDELQDNYTNLQDDFNELKDDYDELQTKIQSNQIPYPSFIPETIKPYQTEVIRFDGSGSNDVDGEIIEYRWDFGNGDFASGYMVDYSFDEVGEYTVTLTVTDNNSTKNSTSEKITVENAIIITVSEASQYFDPEDYEIIFTFKNNGDLTAHTEEAYWSLKTVDGTLYSPNYCYPNTVGGGKTEDFTMTIYDVTGIPNKLIYNDSPFHQEVDIDI
jgi:archaellum component FlaC